MSELRVGASVAGTDGRLGQVEAVVIDPTDDAVTHLVVAGDALSPPVLLPLSAVVDATPEEVRLAVDAAGFGDFPPFEEPSYNAGAAAWTSGEMVYDPGTYFLEPYVTPLDDLGVSSFERIPKGEVTIRRHDEVHSSDGTRVGHVDEFLVDVTDGHITHVVLREGHVFTHDRDVVVPLAGATIEEGRVVLGLDLAALHELERIPVTRHGHVRGGADG